MTSAKAFAAPKLGRSTARRGPVVVRAEKVSHGKGGEEGGATFNNDAFGMVAKNANYMLFATAVSKVRPVIPTAIRGAIDSARETRARRPGARSTTRVSREIYVGSRDVRFSAKQCPVGRRAPGAATTIDSARARPTGRLPIPRTAVASRNAVAWPHADSCARPWAKRLSRFRKTGSKARHPKSDVERARVTRAGSIFLTCPSLQNRSPLERRPAARAS